MVIDKNHHIWLLNAGDEALNLEPGELFGFGTGQFSVSVECGSVSIVGSFAELYFVVIV